METSIQFSNSDEKLWDKIERMKRIDPAMSAGIDNPILGRRPLSASESMGRLLQQGFSEIHPVDHGFCSHIGDAVIAQDWRLTGRSDDHTLRLRVSFAGEANYCTPHGNVADESSLCSFVIQPAGEPCTATYSGGAEYRYCLLSLTRDYLRKTLALSDEELPTTLLAHWDRRETVMGHFPLSKASLAQAGRFFTIKSTRTWRELEVRTISLDLLRLLFHDWRNAHTKMRTSIRITPLERDKLLRTRELIDRNPNDLMTIPMLSAKLRINRNKLHFGFKRLYGVSIRDYQTNCRMQAARELLISTDMPIGEVAERTGYSEPTNFTAAFKKHFALLPSQARPPSKDLTITPR